VLDYSVEDGPPDMAVARDDAGEEGKFCGPTVASCAVTNSPFKKDVLPRARAMPVARFSDRMETVICSIKV
jgi:hypothetical protein